MSAEPRIAFLARDLVWADESGGVLPFSYAARKLDASLRSAPDLAGVESTVIDLRTDDPEAFFARIREFRPTLIAASTYIWSTKVFCQVAKQVRAWDSSVRFVMGGPAARPSLLSLAPYAPYVDAIDAVVVGEGEEVVRELARKHLHDDWRREVAGLVTPSPLGWRHATPQERPALDGYASPYQLGNVPRDEVGFLETFRGCPMRCAFCQWGDERSDRVHSVDYLAGHLRGMADSGVERVYVLDAGFNLSPRAFRNLMEAERQEQVLEHCQVLGHIYPTHIRDEHLDFFDTFARAEVTVGIQSFDTAVLQALGRRFDIPRFEAVMAQLQGRLDIDLELILGLPGDNPRSFRRTLERAMEFATTVRVFYCLALPDALLDRADELGIEFDPETFMVTRCEGWTLDELKTEWAYVLELAQSCHRPHIGPNWVDFRPNPPRRDPPVDATPKRSSNGPAARPGDRRPTELSSASRASLGEVIDGSGTGWRLHAARVDGGALLLDLSRERRTLILEVTPARHGQRRFRELEGLAYSYRGELATGEAERLTALILYIHAHVHATVKGLHGVF
ncbi:B12-binding domain-containing radical SAM protein [Paraliomyxa miuraensis]|uniref:B12-binding domain-containing radical SAM protein n=1 Tax=Paraliomyxa miuraensis TaxID=376150 RepID=UPI002258805C|nr:radical SAM protein [Paraliomyxa miuraensis]MCX4243643.1 cobalamin-dependent protein [Paraliomyxa miuraensis]